MSARLRFPSTSGDLIGAHLSTRGGLSTVFLHEDAAGRILAGLQDFDARVIRIVELHDGGVRRRPARPRVD